MTTYYPLEKLRKIPGLEHAKYVDPYAGSKGNSMRYLSVAPRTNDIGDIISYENEQSKTRDGRKVRYTFAGAGYFKRMQELGLYTLNIKEIKNKVTKLNLDNIFNTKLC